MIEFEHTIFIILLLTGVLNAKPPRQRWATVIILIGVLLVFVPPTNTIKVSWDLVLGLAIPLLLWQNVRRTVNAEWRGWKNVALWGFSVLIFGFALWLGDALNWPGAMLFGVIAASMIWRAGEPESGSSYMSQVGPLTLIFLLTEVEAAILAPNHYVGGIFSGAFFGVIAALFGLFLLKKTSPKSHFWIGLGQVFFAYWLSFFLGVSAVAAAFVSVMTFVWLNQYYQLGFHEKAPPAPLNTWPGFGFILALFMLLGWQSHQPVSYLFIIEVFVGVLLGLGITWLGRRWQIPAFYKEKPYWMAASRIALLLFPALLLWPRSTLQHPAQLAVALGITVLVIGMSYLALSYYFPKKGFPHWKDSV
jgi:hypothetical protein